MNKNNNIFTTKEVLDHILYYIWKDTTINTDDVSTLEELLCNLQSNELNVLYGTEPDRDDGEPGGHKTAKYEYIDGKRWQYTGHADMSRCQLYVFATRYNLRISVYDTFGPQWEDGELIGKLCFDYVEDDGYTELSDFIDEIRDEMSDCEDDEYSQLKKYHDDLVSTQSLADVISVITAASDDAIADIVEKVSMNAKSDKIIEAKINTGCIEIKLFCNVYDNLISIDETNFYRSESTWSMFSDERPRSIHIEYNDDGTCSVSREEEKANA